MKPERWQQINEIYHDAMELDANRQATFLSQACAGDEELRDEVESLIASHDQAGSFIAEPALKVAARILAEDQTTSLVGRRFSHYRIESLLGVGGMGEVYLAEDTKLDRKVAVKILNEEFSQHESNLNRFIQEAKTASALNHPGILVIHEIGVSEEANYIVSEYIEGKTLREIVRESSMQLPEVLDVSIQIANALRTAHDANLVHRDIKPENIMIRPDGYLKILDFGLAKLIEHENKSILGLEDGTGRKNQTAKAVILGTVNYMSPEQAKGESVDERTDIFSLGVVIHEMVVGRTPFAGDSISETFANLLTAEPPPLSSFDPNLPEALQRIISKMLRKNREERYQTMTELLTDLKDLKEDLRSDEKLKHSDSPDHHATKVQQSTTGEANKQSADTQQGFSTAIKQHKSLTAFALVALLFAAIGLGYYFFAFRKTASGAGGKTSIAVLPLKPINTANRDEVYEIGVADSLILKLSSMKGFIVRPLSATRKYADIGQDPIAAGKEQQVDFVLASNYELARGKIRITAQLFNVANGQIEETYKSEEKDAANVFAMQDAIAGEVGKVLSARFATTSSSPAAKRGTTNEEAYRLYLQGMYFNGKRTPADARKAAEVLEQAVRLDSNYARAWAGLAQVHRTLGNFGGTNVNDEFHKSIEALNKALALDENLADVHSALCDNKMSYEWDFDGAERECQRAVELDPNSSLAHLIYSRYLNGQGRFDAAIAEVKTAIDIEPTSLVSQRHYGTCLYYARRYPEAVTQFKRVIAMDKGFGTTYNWLVVALEMQGNYPEAFEWWMKMLALYKEPEEAIQAFQAAYQTSGWQGLLLERARRCDEASFRPNYPGPYFQGAVEHAKVGHKDKAFDYLEKSFQRREMWMTLLKVEPGLDSLRHDPRFDELVKRVGLN